MNQLIANLPPLVLSFAFVGFWAWEGLAVARSNPSGWGRRGGNLLISAVGIVISGLAASALLALSSTAADLHWGLAYWDIAGSWFLPPWVVAIVGVLLLDLTDYWRHRISHRVPLLWRLHRLHHSDPIIDATISLRSHPAEFLLRPLFLGTAILVFGIPPLPLLLHPVLQLPILIFQHANIRLPVKLDRALSWLIVTPAMHLVHHSRAQLEADSNYSVFLTVWDRLFTTLTPSVPPAALGLDGLDDAAGQRFFRMLILAVAARRRMTMAGPGNERAVTKPADDHVFDGLGALGGCTPSLVQVGCLVMWNPRTCEARAKTRPRWPGSSQNPIDDLYSSA